MIPPFIWQYWDEDDNDRTDGDDNILEDQFWILVRLIILFLPVIVTYKMIIICEKFLHNDNINNNNNNTPIIPIMPMMAQ